MNHETLFAILLFKKTQRFEGWMFPRIKVWGGGAQTPLDPVDPAALDL
jgi:hypothetical protein